jgi:hypothetical protein
MLSQMLKAASRSAAHTGEVRLALEAADIPSFWRTIHEAQGELRRCRRYEHPLSVLVVGVDSETLRSVARSEGRSADPEAWFVRRFECAALLVLGWILRDATREIDSVSYASESHNYVVVLPETDAPGARAAARRLSDLFEMRSSVALSVGVAAFPADGLTVEDLFHHACAALAEAPAPRSATPAVSTSASSGAAPTPSHGTKPVGEAADTPAPARRAPDLPVIGPVAREQASGGSLRRASNG